jgi:hypothetical protein
MSPLELRRKSQFWRFAQNKDEIYAGLDNVGTVHFARFVIVDDNIFVCSPYICMFSVYDGDFTKYIRDFIATMGVFNGVVALVKGGDAVFRPCSAGAHGSPSVDDIPAGLREVKPRPAGCGQLEHTVTQPGPAFLDSVPSHFIKL